MKDYILEFIVELAKGAKKGEKRFESCISSAQSEAEGSELYNCRYLLSQILRQYKLPKGHRHISENAKNLWESLTSADPKNYEYNEVILCDKLSSTITVNTYKGASKTVIQRELNRGDKIKFNDIFTAEHVIPINMIVDELVEIAINKNITKEIQLLRAKETLNKIHTCMITKDEDKKIKHMTKRDGDFETIIKKEYNPVGIKVENTPIE